MRRAYRGTSVDCHSSLGAPSWSKSRARCTWIVVGPKLVVSSRVRKVCRYPRRASSPSPPVRWYRQAWRTSSSSVATASPPPVPSASPSASASCYPSPLPYPSLVAFGRPDLPKSPEGYGIFFLNRNGDGTKRRAPRRLTAHCNIVNREDQAAVFSDCFSFTSFPSANFLPL